MDNGTLGTSGDRRIAKPLNASEVAEILRAVLR